MGGIRLASTSTAIRYGKQSKWVFSLLSTAVRCQTHSKVNCHYCGASYFTLSHNFQFRSAHVRRDWTHAATCYIYAKFQRNASERHNWAHANRVNQVCIKWNWYGLKREKKLPIYLVAHSYICSHDFCLHCASTFNNNLLILPNAQPITQRVNGFNFAINFRSMTNSPLTPFSWHAFNELIKIIIINGELKTSSPNDFALRKKENRCDPNPTMQTGNFIFTTIKCFTKK